MPSHQEHEQGLSLFIEQRHRVRFRDSLDNERLRRKLRQRLAHFDWLDDRYVEWVPSEDAGVVARELRERGATEECVVVSEDDDLDGRGMALDDTLSVTLGDHFGALLSCVPGRLAIYIEEAPNQEVAMLQRTGS